MTADESLFKITFQSIAQACDEHTFALDANDVPYVAYHSHDGSNDNMEMKRLAGNQWTALPMVGKGGGGIADMAIIFTEEFALKKTATDSW